MAPHPLARHRHRSAGEAPTARASLVDEDASLRRALEVLAGSPRPLTVAELADAGIDHPAVVLYELELAGYDVERVRVRREDGAAGLAFRIASPPPRPGGEPAPRRRLLAHLRPAPAGDAD